MENVELTTRIVIMAKAPVPGAVKTRLIPALGAGGAARLAQRMLAATLDQALAGNVGPVELCADPPVDDPAWRSVALPPGIEVSTQGDGDLGARMARAAERTTARGEAILLIGTDAPELDAPRLHQAASLLRKADAVLFPAVDGGYVVLGLHRGHALLFDGIPWGTETVAADTLRRLARLGWSVEIGPTLHDIDEPDDLAASASPLSN